MNESQRIGPWVINLFLAPCGYQIDVSYNGKHDEDLSDCLQNEEVAHMYYNQVVQKCQLEVSLKL